MSLSETDALMSKTCPEYTNLNKKNNASSKLTSRLSSSSFSFKQCQSFQEAYEEVEVKRCFCGQLKDLHKESASEGEMNWTPSYIKRVTPTNAFGSIVFTREEAVRGKSGYIRVSDEDDTGAIFEYMRAHWSFMDNGGPTMCVSIVGYNFEFTPSLAKMMILFEYLYSIFIGTKTLVIWNGFQSGIGRMVADLCNKINIYHSGSENERSFLSTLGIAPWGHVALGEMMEKEEVPSTFSYEIADDEPGNFVRHLTPDAQNYLLIDDGYFHNRISQNFYNASANFEKHIASVNGCGIPTILIVVGGDYTILREIYARLLAGIPIIIMEDENGCVGAITSLRKIKKEHRSTEKNATPKFALDFIEEIAISASEFINHDEVVEICEYIFFYMDSIYFVDVRSDEELSKIPNALILTCEDRIAAISLATILKQSVAAKDLLSMLNYHDNKGIEKLMYEFITSEKAEFIDMLLESNVHMSTFLTVDALQRLYQNSISNETLMCCLNYFLVDFENETEKTGIFSKCRKKVSVVSDNEPTIDEKECAVEESRSKLKLHHVNILLHKLTGNFHSENYVMTQSAEISAVQRKRFEGPFQELFVWALLCNKLELANFFWKRSDNNIFLAIFGSYLCRAISKIIPETEVAIKMEYAEAGDYYEQLAINITNFGFSLYGDFNRSILITRKETWKSDDVSWLAMSGKCRQFLGILPIQDYIYFQWRNNVESKLIWFILGLFCPVLIKFEFLFSFDKFERKIGEKQSRIDDTHTSEKVTPQSSVPLTYCEKVAAVYTSHRARYWMRLITYIPMLLFLTWTIFFDFVPDYYSTTELISAAILLSLLVDGLYSIILMGIKCGKYRIGYYLGLNFVWAELVTIFLTVICFVLRIGFQEEFGHMKTASAVLLMILYWKLFLFFPMNCNLGSSLLSLIGMVFVALKFMLIIVVILLPSAIAQQSLLFPSLKNLDVELLSDLFFYDYYRLFGELNLDRSNAIQENCTENSDDPRCPTSNFFVLIIVATYMLIAGIFLVNFLIALFNNVIEDVDERAFEIWKYNIVVENVIYECRWISPPPLCLIEAIVRGIMYCIVKGKNKDLNDTASENREDKNDDGREIQLTEAKEAYNQAFQAIQNLANQNFDTIDQELSNQSDLECAMRLRECANLHVVASRCSLDAINSVINLKTNGKKKITAIGEENESSVPTIEELEFQLTEFENNVTSLVTALSDLFWKELKGDEA